MRLKSLILTSALSLSLLAMPALAASPPVRYVSPYTQQQGQELLNVYSMLGTELSVLIRTLNAGEQQHIRYKSWQAQFNELSTPTTGDLSSREQRLLVQLRGSLEKYRAINDQYEKNLARFLVLNRTLTQLKSVQ